MRARGDMIDFISVPCPAAMNFPAAGHMRMPAAERRIDPAASRVIGRPAGFIRRSSPARVCFVKVAPRHKNTYPESCAAAF
jgi:hypothetical protein